MIPYDRPSHGCAERSAKDHVAQVLFVLRQSRCGDIGRHRVGREAGFPSEVTVQDRGGSTVKRKVYYNAVSEPSRSIFREDRRP